MTVTPDGAGFRISGVPKGMAQRVKLLSLGVTAAGAIERMRLEEVDGAVTEFSFSDDAGECAGEGSDFAFVPPDGVIGGRGAAADLARKSPLAGLNEFRLTAH